MNNNISTTSLILLIEILALLILIQLMKLILLILSISLHFFMWKKSYLPQENEVEIFFWFSQAWDFCYSMLLFSCVSAICLVIFGESFQGRLQNTSVCIESCATEDPKCETCFVSIGALILK